jgi:hypothetical protein
MSDYPIDPTDLEALLAGETILAENVPYEEFLQRFAGQRTEWVLGYVIENTLTNNTKHKFILNTLNYLFGLFLNYRLTGSKVILA